MKIELHSGAEYQEEAVRLFQEYTDYLVSQDERFARYLAMQHYAREISNPLEKYGEPAGRLYVATADGRTAGCGALKPLAGHDGVCELKRLYVRPEFRGEGIGKMLMEQIVADARSIGYSTMYLDTLPFLTDAIGMYRRYGFYDIGRYNDNPLDGSVFLAYDL